MHKKKDFHGDYLQIINTIVFLTLTRLRGRYVRRANNILEVTGIKDDKPTTNNIFKWVPKGDEFVIDGKSFVLKNIAERLALSESGLRGELARRRKVIKWMYKSDIYDYREVARIISAYYNNPDKVMRAIGE